MKLTLLISLALCVAACQPEKTSIAIAIDAPGLTIMDLGVHVMLASGESKGDQITPKLPGRVVVILPDVAVQVTVSASAIDTNGVTWHPSATTTSRPHHQVDVALHIGNGAPGDLAGSDLSVDDGGSDRADMPPAVPSLTLLAGAVGGSGEVDGKGSDARMTSTQGVALAGASVYVTDMFSGQVRKVAADGTVTTLQLVDSQTGNRVSLDWGTGIAWDGAQYLYAAEYDGCSLQRIDPTDPTHAPTKRVSGSGGGSCGLSDGDVDHSQLDKPDGMAFDGSGKLWITDTGSNAVRIYDPTTGLLSTAAGAPGGAASVDGSGGAGGTARFGALAGGITVIAKKVYVTDGATIRLIDSSLAPTLATYVTTTLPAGANGFVSLAGIGPGDGGSLIAFDEDGVVHRVVPGAPPSFTIVAGAPYQPYPLDGDGSAAVLQNPALTQVDGNGLAWFADGSTLRTLEVGAPWTVTTIAGLGSYGGGSNTPPRLDAPEGLAWDGADTVYLADYGGCQIRTYQLSTGVLGTLAGSGSAGEHDDVGLAATFAGPSGLALDDAGHLFVVDRDKSVIRKITLATQLVQTVAGTAGNGGPPPGFNTPVGIVFDGDHTLYIGDAYNNVVRTLDSVDNTLGILAGTGVSGAADGPAASATFAGPSGLALDRAHQILYVADSGNQVIRQISLGVSGMPVKLVSGTVGDTGDNGMSERDNTTLTNATYYSPINVAFDDTTGLLYVADYDDAAVRKLDLVAGRVSTLVGDGVGRTKPGPLPANIHGPWGILPTSRGLVMTSQAENALLLAK